MQVRWRLRGRAKGMHKIGTTGRRRTWLSTPRLQAAVLVLATGLVGTATGCRVNEDDLHRWEGTQRGPEKLRAVVKAAKYEMPLRVEAAVSLIRMRPRAGRQVGIDLLVESLADISPEQRGPLLAGLIPEVIAELKKAPPAAQAGQAAPPDPSFPFKDAAYAILTYEKQVLISDDGLKQSLRSSLIDWAMADFERRLENRTQSFGMEQLLRLLGTESVVALPKLINSESRNLDKLASLVADLGDQPTKEAASVALVEVAKHVTSERWVQVKTPQLEAANKASKLEPTPDQFKGQLEQYQDEELMRVFGSLKRVGGRAAVDFCLDFANDGKNKKERRAAALAALELRLDATNDSDLKRIFAIALSDSPPEVLDLAFRRIGEMPRDKVIDRLYEGFKTDKWKVRRAAGSIVLRMSTMSHLDEFMSKLPEKDSKGFAMPEAITFGAMITDLKEGKPREALAKHLKEGSAAARGTAVSFYLTQGTAADLSTLSAFESDNGALPVCDADPECKWACYVAKDAAKPDEKELRDIKTVGEYIKLCAIPSIKDREEAAKKAAEPKGDKK